MPTRRLSKMVDEGRVPGSSAFGTLLRHYRLAAGLSQEALAERARMSANGIGALERGYRRSPQRETLALLADALKLDDEQRREFEAAAARSEVPRRIGGGWATSGPLTAAAISNLPIALTSFIGREHDVVQVKDLVNRHRLLTLVGSGGVGKTRLALHVGAELLDRYPDGVWFVDLAPITDPELVASVIAQSLGMNQQEGRRVDESILQWLKRKRLLLIFDNCEHLLDMVASIAGSILNTVPDVRILATSRQAFNIGGEVAHRLPSLSIPSEAAGLKMDEALQYGAVALFVDRAYAVTPDSKSPTTAHPSLPRSAAGWTVFRWRSSLLQRASTCSLFPTSHSGSTNASRFLPGEVGARCPARKR